MRTVTDTLKYLKKKFLAYFFEESKLFYSETNGTSVPKDLEFLH